MCQIHVRKVYLEHLPLHPPPPSWGPISVAVRAERGRARSTRPPTWQVALAQASPASRSPFSAVGSFQKQCLSSLLAPRGQWPGDMGHAPYTFISSPCNSRLGLARQEASGQSGPRKRWE